MNRRTFIKTLGASVAAALGIRTAQAMASGPPESSKELVGVLVDTTRCIGCRECEAACASAHGMPPVDLSDASAFDQPRMPSTTALTAVGRHQTEKGTVYVKKQCMHCNQPGCVAPCLVKAMVKMREGPVLWNTNCMGCRICMVSCPFDMPKFEFEKPFPKIQKCDLCWERLIEGKQPACVEACPSEALVFGTRRQLVHEANTRIYGSKGGYVRHIYGEREVGGTGYMYLSAVPFEQLGFRIDLGETAYPELTMGFMSTVLLVDVLWPAFLLGAHALSRGKEGVPNVKE